jgi:filamentous hemagglutinin
VSALHDTGAAIWNIGVALNGDVLRDDYRVEYDTPWFGTTVETLLPVGAIAKAARLSAAARAGTFSRIVPGGGLAAHEVAGGHLLARHVGQTQAQLAQRLATQPGISAASTFATRAEAEAAVSAVLDANAAQVSSWVASGANGRLVLEGAFQGGSVLSRSAASAVQGNAARVVLQGTQGGNYRILTGFPIL